MRPPSYSDRRIARRRQCGHVGGIPLRTRELASVILFEREDNILYAPSIRTITDILSGPRSAGHGAEITPLRSVDLLAAGPTARKRVAGAQRRCCFSSFRLYASIELRPNSQGAVAMFAKGATFVALAAAVSAAPTSSPLSSDLVAQSSSIDGLLHGDGFTSGKWQAGFEKARKVVAGLSFEQKSESLFLRTRSQPVSDLS